MAATFSMAGDKARVKAWGLVVAGDLPETATKRGRFMALQAALKIAIQMDPIADIDIILSPSLPIA